MFTMRLRKGQALGKRIKWIAVILFENFYREGMQRNEVHLEIKGSA